MLNISIIFFLVLILCLILTWEISKLQKKHKDLNEILKRAHKTIDEIEQLLDEIDKKEQEKNT